MCYSWKDNRSSVVLQQSDHHEVACESDVISDRNSPRWKNGQKKRQWTKSRRGSTELRTRFKYWKTRSMRHTGWVSLRRTSDGVLSGRLPLELDRTTIEPARRVEERPAPLDPRCLAWGPSPCGFAPFQCFLFSIREILEECVGDRVALRPLGRHRRKNPQTGVCPKEPRFFFFQLAASAQGSCSSARLNWKDARASLAAESLGVACSLS